MLKEYTDGFPKGFLWGGATAANQFEGGYREGGKTEFILFLDAMARASDCRVAPSNQWLVERYCIGL